jgi:hypothetical protein
VRWHDLVLEKVQIIASDSNFHVVASKSLNRSAIQDPTVVSSDYLSPMQIEKLARAEHSTLALVGQLTRAPSGQLLSLNMRVENAVTHKVVAEVARSWHTESNSEEASFLAKIKSETEIATNELTTQLHQNWLHGTIMSNSFRLVIRGLETPNQEAAMRSSLARAYKEIKSVAPRAFEHGEIEYEIEFNGDFKAFTEKMKLMTAPGFDMHFREAETVANNRSRVVIEAKPRVSDKASDRK